MPKSTHQLRRPMSLNDAWCRELSAAKLPGPDTHTKLDAIKTDDPRLRGLLRIAQDTGRPSAYTNDLYLTDRRILASFPDEPLIWILRENGTHLLITHCHTNGEAKYARDVIEYWSGDHYLNATQSPDDRARYFLVEPKRIREVAARRALECIRVEPNTTDG